MPKIASLAPLTTQLPPWPKLIRGSLIRCYLTCGQKSCRCHRKKAFKHGPYWYLSINHHGKTRMFKLKDFQVAAVRQATQAYKGWWKTCLKIFELNTKLILSKEA